jgi:hypothetical protein
MGKVDEKESREVDCNKGEERIKVYLKVRWWV